MLFPWIEDVIKKISSKFNPTATGLLTLWKELRLLSIQDCDVLIWVHNRMHLLLREIREIFKSKVFINYTYKIKVF